MTGAFFDEQSDQSLIKATITPKYFWAWARVITGFQKRKKSDPKIAYIDLFAGPGRYKDGAKSTPLMILEQAIEDPLFRQSLVTIFNDKDEDHASSLEEAITALPGIESLRFKPRVSCSDVGDEVVKAFEQAKLIPTLMFVDPWGYRGLSLRLVNSVLKDWACECIFFFNYNRINMGMNNDAVKPHMEALFGADNVDEIRRKLEQLPPEEREATVIEELSHALREMGGKYVLPFRFRNAKGTRTSHHLIFVSKHPLGYNIMKDIMAKESSTKDQGVAKFEYNPADKRQPFLFQLTRPLDDLEDMLLDTFAGRNLSVQNVFDEHNIDTPYVMKNYKEVLIKKYQDGTIQAARPSGKPIRANSFPEDIVVSFPVKS